jgi:PKHD-type hydroxylase
MSQTNKNISYILQGESEFQESEINYLRSLLDEQSVAAGINPTGDVNKQSNPEVRRTNIHWLEPHNNETVYKKVLKLLLKANEYFSYEVQGLQDRIQLALYDSAEQSLYDWHLDVGPGTANRKISLTIPLNEPTEYKGGDLEIMYNSKIKRPKKRKGLAIIFPSFLLHRVSPAIKGKRYSLVAWAEGKNNWL